MGDLMDGEEKVLICRCTDNVRGEEKRNWHDRCISQSRGAEQLQSHDKYHAILSQGLGTAQLKDLPIFIS